MIEVVRADITTLAVDVVVNAANEALRGGGGVDGAIHRAAGPALLEELTQWEHCPTGSAVITRGHRLPARWIVHAVGPIWRGGEHGEASLLERAYRESFRLASERSARTIAFAAISTGVYGYPRREAAAIATRVMREHEPHFDRIIACLFDDEQVEIYRRALGTAAP